MGAAPIRLATWGHSEGLGSFVARVLEHDWRVNARCHKESPEKFFPTGRPPKSLTDLCQECPVRAACLETALTSPWEPYGIWGGLTQSQLRPLWRDRHPIGEESEVLAVIGIAK